jgi:hypothetical protein
MKIRRKNNMIPLIAVGVGSALLGIGKGIKAASDNADAGSINRKANSILDEEKERLENCRSECGKSLESLGRKKLFILDKSICQFTDAFGKLQNINLEDSQGLDEIGKFRLDQKSFDELREMSSFAASLLGGVAGGTIGGALTAFGAYSAAMTFASASTGTAIATLSGVAATNATLAFFGGGSIAVGGLGIAGGTMVLGGLVAGPALAIMGFTLAAKAKENLNNAYSNLAEARKIAEELKTASTLCDAIRRRSYMFERLLIRLDAMFTPLVYRMDAIIAEKGMDYHTFSLDEKHVMAKASSLAKAIKTVLDTPILSESGELTEESGQVALQIGDYAI